MINLILKQEDLAKVSKTAGKTRLINFFTVDGGWHLVDLPGYGYAKVGHGVQDHFNEAVSAYLSGRPNLKLIMVLVDARFEPMEIDLQFLTWLEQLETPRAIVFTKTDEVSEATWKRHLDVYTETLQALGLRVPTMIRSSAKNRAGRGDLLAFIEKTVPAVNRKRSSPGISLTWLG